MLSGLSDFQYLPMTQTENPGEYKSICNEIFPNFGDPENDNLFDAIKMETGEKPSQPFFLPMYMSKFDKPMVYKIYFYLKGTSNKCRTIFKLKLQVKNS